jgi:hypothetical protein
MISAVVNEKARRKRKVMKAKGIRGMDMIVE